MKKIYQIGHIHERILENLSELPQLADTNVFSNSIVVIDFRWRTSEAEEQDVAMNKENWREFINRISSDLSNEKEVDDLVIIAPNIPMIVEARNEVIDEFSKEKGVGPKRMNLLRRMTTFWVPYQQRVKLQNFKGGHGYRKNRDKFGGWDRQQQQQNDRPEIQFVRWVKI